MNAKPRAGTIRLALLLGASFLIAGLSHRAEACSDGSDAAACDPEWTYAFPLPIIENDSFINGSDKHYTNGLQWYAASDEQKQGVGWAYEPLAFVARNLFIGPEPDRSRLRWAAIAGQSMFTPENLLTRNPRFQDRPYGGWLYAGVDAYRESDATADRLAQLDRFELTVGVVGPAAGGHFTQDTWHKWTQGAFGGENATWAHQLRNEPGIVLAEERKWRIPVHVGSFEGDLLPEANVSLGNIYTYGGFGGIARFGQGLSADWGPPRVQPGVSGSYFMNRRGIDQGLGGFGVWYFFIGGETRLVARNIFLDGNSFRSSSSASKNAVVADFVAGFETTLIPAVRLSTSYTFRTKEFVGQRADDQFLSINLAFHM